MRFKHALLFALLAMALVIVFFAITECVFYDEGLLDKVKEEVEKGDFPDGMKIDDTVWEREPTKKGGEAL